MKKILLFLLFLPLTMVSQKLKCEDFKNGNFTMTCDKFPNIIITMSRYDDVQTETLLKNESSIVDLGTEIIYEKIEWLSDCKYKLMFDFTKSKETELMKYLNDNGGVITSIIKIEDHCYLYESILIIDGKKEKLSGEICKDINY